MGFFKSYVKEVTKLAEELRGRRCYLRVVFLHKDHEKPFISNKVESLNIVPDPNSKGDFLVYDGSSYFTGVGIDARDLDKVYWETPNKLVLYRRPDSGTVIIELY